MVLFILSPRVKKFIFNREQLNIVLFNASFFFRFVDLYFSEYIWGEGGVSTSLKYFAVLIFL